MKTILENELVGKYFGCTVCDPKYHGLDGFQKCPYMALRVIEAMSAPIRSGERYLHIQGDGFATEQYPGWDSGTDSFHPFSLRLPDSFQEQEEKNLCALVSIQEECPGCGKDHVWAVDTSAKPTARKCQLNHGTGSKCDCKAATDPVEEKIKDIMNSRIGGISLNKIDDSLTKGTGFRNDLLDLVALAKRQAQQ